MTLQPEDFLSFSEWLFRPDDFLRGALLSGVVVSVFFALIGLIVAYALAAAKHGPGESFYAMAGVLRDFFTRDLPLMSPRRIYALARLAFKEAIRRRVLIGVAIFAIGLMMGGWYLDSGSDDPGTLYISFVLNATNFLMLGLALFISCHSIPGDIESRRIYTLVTKPVRPTEIVLGRILGFIAVGTVMLVPMGLVSYLFITRGLSHSHQMDEVVDETGAEGESTLDHFHRHDFEIDEEDQGLTNIKRTHTHKVTRTKNADGTLEFQFGPPSGNLRARIPQYGELSYTNRNGVESTSGIDVGNPHRAGGYSSSGLKGLLTERTADRIEHAYIEGGTLATAIFTFDNVTPDRFLDPSLPPEEQALNLEMRIRAYRAHKGVISEVLEGSYTIEHPDPRVNRRSEAFRFSVNEYNVDEQFIPIVMLPDTGSELPVDENGQELEELNLFDHLSEDGKIKIVIRCENTGQYIGMTKSDVYLRRAESSFEWNLTKAFISIWLQMVMIISFGVMFSTRLNGAVSMVSTMSLVLMGLSSEMIFEIRHYMDRGDEMGGGPIESLIRLVRQDSMTTQLDIGGVAERIVKTFDTIIVYLMDAYATSLPNLPQMFQTSEYAAGGYDIFNDLLLRHSTATLGYFVAAVVIGYFFLKTREIAAQ